MTLDEAIAKAKADGDVQLAEWLRQARGADAAARWYTEKLRDASRTIRKLQTENAKLRELCADMLWTIKHAHGWYKNDTHEMLMTDVRWRDGEPTNVSHSLTTDEEMYEKRMRELGVSDGTE